MSVDIGILTTTIVSSFLIPYVKVGVEKFIEEAGKTVGKTAADHAGEVSKKVWERVKSVFSSDEDKSILMQFEKRPEAAKSLVETILREKLESDSRLAQELSELVNTLSSDGKSTAAQIMHAGIAGIVDVRDTDFSHARGVTITGVTIGGSPSQQSASLQDRRKES